MDCPIDEIFEEIEPTKEEECPFNRAYRRQLEKARRKEEKLAMSGSRKLVNYRKPKNDNFSKFINFILKKTEYLDSKPMEKDPIDTDQKEEIK